jgi:hypothetical protein
MQTFSVAVGSIEAGSVLTPDELLAGLEIPRDLRSLQRPHRPCRAGKPALAAVDTD